MQVVSCAMVVVLAVAGLLGGCADQAALDAAQAPRQDGSYQCQRALQAGDTGSPERRMVAVQVDPATRNAILTFSGDRRQVLSLLAGASHNLYANELYAWRINAQDAVLTDIDRVSTFACKRIG